jgi:hypothetical protein
MIATQQRSNEPIINVGPYGQVFLRKFDGFQSLKIHMCVEQTVPEFIPKSLEYYCFRSVDQEQLNNRLSAMGYEENACFTGLNECSINPSSTAYVLVSQHAGKTFNTVWNSLSDDFDSLQELSNALGRCLGALHNAGIICGDMHPMQFLVDENNIVRRIDVHQSWVHMDVVKDHKFFGGLNECWFEPRRLTEQGFRKGIGNEIRPFKTFLSSLNAPINSKGQLISAFEQGYLETGGKAEWLELSCE